MIRSHSRSGVVKGVAGEVVTVAGGLWKRVVGRGGVLDGVSTRHLEEASWTRLNTYKVVNAPVVGCRNWGAAWLRVGVLVGVASAVSRRMKKTKKPELCDAQLDTSPSMLVEFLP